MKNLAYRTVDKADWGPGEWQDEPDKMQWTDHDTGYACLIVRNRVGALCGYVGCPEGHPLFGKSDHRHTDESMSAYMKASSEAREKYGGYENIPDDDLEGIHQPNPNYSEMIDKLEVHGGVTFTGGCHTVEHDDWERLRKRLLRSKQRTCKNRRRPQVVQYPYGDAADDWKRLGRFVNDFDGYVEHCEASGICHKTEPGESEVTWIGFDCAHYMDFMPGMEANMRRIRGRYPESFPHVPYAKADIYRNVAYVQHECQQLAKQLKDIADGKQPERED